MRDLNKSYKKIDWLRWHKEKAFIRMFCAFSMSILLIILLLMFPIVGDCAETKLSDLYYFNSILNSDDAMENYSGNPYDIVLPNQNYRNIYYDKETAFTYEDELKDLLDKTVDLNTTYDYITIYKTDDTYLIVKLHSSSIVYAVSNYSVLNVNINESCPTYSYRLSDGQFLHLSDSSLSYSSSSRFIILLSTSPINYRWNPSGDNGEINYMYENNQCGQGPGGLNITQPYPNESSDNNLVFNQSDFIFTHQTYYAPYSSSINTGSAVPVGTISFKGQPNDYQLEHSEEFDLQFTFSFDYNVNYKNYNSTVGYFKQTNSVLGNQKNLKLSIVNNVPITVPLSTFINNKNQYSMDIKTIFDSLLIDNNTSLSGLLAQSKEITEISYNQFLITCNARLVSNGKSSGAYTENYNFNSRKGLTTDKSIEDNPNPYVPNPSEQANDDPDSTNIEPTPNVPGPGGSDGGGGSTTVNANPNVVIYNTPTFNNNPSATATATADGSGSLLSKLIDTLFGSGNVSEGSIGGYTQDKLITNTGASRWFQVANDSMSWIPASVWAELLTFLGITLGILVVAFILRIILDFL